VPGINSQVPIIALTAYAMAGDRAKCLAAGMDEHVAKPIRMGELRGAMERAGLLRAAGSAHPARPVERALDEGILASVRALPGLRGPSLLGELIELYQSDEAERLDRLARLAGNRAADELAHEAHGFAGNAGSFGAVRVRTVALAVERAARAGEWAGVEAELKALRVAAAELHEALRSLKVPVA
jgi:CheY-like chemotaxis protein